MNRQIYVNSLANNETDGQRQTETDKRQTKTDR